MPQMVPMNWMSSFIIILLMILCLIHSFYLIDKSENLPNIINEQINWKWYLIYVLCLTHPINYKS